MRRSESGTPLRLIAVLSGLAIAPSAQAAPAYRLYVGGFERLRPGVLAASKQGAVAFGADSDVYTVRGTRLVRVPVPAEENPEIAYGPTEHGATAFGRVGLIGGFQGGG